MLVRTRRSQVNISDTMRYQNKENTVSDTQKWEEQRIMKINQVTYFMG